MRIQTNFARQAFTLLEVTIAMAIASAAMTYTISRITEGILLQKRAVLLANAVHLAKIKMAQVDSSTSMQSDTTKGNIEAFPGYSFETEIKEEEMDLLKLAAGPDADKLRKNAPKDMLGDKDVGLSDLMKQRGQKRSFETGGLLKVFRVKVSIFYMDGNRKETYSVETFRSTKY
ncbi:prepilin-type N-terminal cleavage/methylation domain-containing protein [Leptospira sp. 96542]|nr:prepilin-type N-terminal cleavage/methylation domain-containing protein [Leptospira sp. 96542]